MLFWPELLGMFLAQPAYNFDSSELRLLGKPAFDRSNVRVKFGGHASPSLIGPVVAAVRGPRLAGRHHLA